MKIARFNGDRIGVVQGQSIADVTEIVDSQPGAWPPVAMNRLIANFAGYRAALEGAGTSKSVALSSVTLLTPVPWPNKIIAYPVNYHEHGVEMGAAYRAN